MLAWAVTAKGKRTVADVERKLASHLTARAAAQKKGANAVRKLGGSVALSLRFDPRPLPPDKLGHVREVSGIEQLIILLHFLDCDPRECWSERFAPSQERLADAALATLAVQAAFVPTRHGTDAYTDELF